VQSNADDWYNYPNFQGTSRSINDSEWTANGQDPQRGYLNWWYDHIPHFSGEGTDHYLNNWWRYISDPDQFKSWSGNLLWAHGQPTVSITAPAQGATVSGNVNVTAAATELQDGAIGRVDLYVDGSYLESDTVSLYTFDWSTVGLSSSQHTLVAKAYDLQNGTEGVSGAVRVNVSN
jgi:hypothetical protein